MWSLLIAKLTVRDIIVISGLVLTIFIVSFLLFKLSGKKDDDKDQDDDRD